METTKDPTQRMSEIRQELSVLNRAMQEILDLHGKTDWGYREILKLKSKYDKLLTELNSYQNW